MSRIGKKATGRSRPSFDMVEIKPQQFMVHALGMRPLLKGEGNFKGQVFELTSWRREGLLARLRAAGFVVCTLADQIDRLRRPPAAVRQEAVALRPLVSAIERFSYFDALALTWVQVVPQTEGDRHVVALQEGWVVRRRRGRGAASFHQVFIERSGGIGLRPFDEIGALLAGYAQAGISGPRYLNVWHNDQSYFLPDIELPRPYRDLLRRFAQLTAEGWCVGEREWGLARQLYEQLGLSLGEGKEASIRT